MKHSWYLYLETVYNKYYNCTRCGMQYRVPNDDNSDLPVNNCFGTPLLSEAGSADECVNSNLDLQVDSSDD